MRKIRSSRTLQSVALLAALLLTASSCQSIGSSRAANNTTRDESVAAPDGPLPRNSSRVVHVFVALCDNEYQGIVPVPARIGNGDDPDNNLYWGAAYGV